MIRASLITSGRERQREGEKKEKEKQCDVITTDQSHARERDEGEKKVIYTIT